MTYGDFKAMVAAYMQRDASAYVVGTTDLLALAINMARKSTERRRDFSLLRVIGEVEISLEDGADIADVVLASDGTTAVDVKTLHKAWIPLPGGNGWFPIRVVSYDSYVAEMQRVYDQIQDINDATQIGSTPVGYFRLIRQGDLLTLTPNDSTVFGDQDELTIRLDVTKWLPDYSAAGDTDFLLEHCTDYMLLQTVYMLNPMLKEDVRVAITERQLDRAWHTVISFDSNLVAQTGDDCNLD